LARVTDRVEPTTLAPWWRERLTLVFGVVLCLLVGLLPCWWLFVHPTTETHIEPVGVSLIDGGDPRVLNVAVPWTEDGWCSGQFTVSATESQSEVRISPVASHLNRGGPCAGLGTVNQRAWATLTLAAPLGDRAVVRASDGTRLPLVDL
jgi:hypothetical protein